MSTTVRRVETGINGSLVSTRVRFMRTGQIGDHRYRLILDATGIVIGSKKKEIYKYFLKSSYSIKNNFRGIDARERCLKKCFKKKRKKAEKGQSLSKRKRQYVYSSFAVRARRQLYRFQRFTFAQ